MWYIYGECELYTCARATEQPIRNDYLLEIVNNYDESTAHTYPTITQAIKKTCTQHDQNYSSNYGVAQADREGRESKSNLCYTGQADT